VEYCPWFRDAITASAQEILDCHIIFTDGAWFHGSGYVNSQHSRACAATNPAETRIHHHMIRRLVRGVPCPQWHCHLGTSMWSDSLPFNWTVLLHTQLVCGPMTPLPSVFGDRSVSREIWPPRSADFTCVGTNERCTAHTPLELKEASASFIRPELSRVFADKWRRVDVCQQARGGHVQHQLYDKCICNNVQGLWIYASSYGRRTVTFGLLCIIESCYCTDPVLLNTRTAAVHRLLHRPGKNATLNWQNIPFVCYVEKSRCNLRSTSCTELIQSDRSQGLQSIASIYVISESKRLRANIK
jgi:hypothetical protein